MDVRENKIVQKEDKEEDFRSRYPLCLMDFSGGTDYFDIENPINGLSYYKWLK